LKSSATLPGVEDIVSGNFSLRDFEFKPLAIHSRNRCRA
jgi:hypothetical protein